MRGRVWLVTVRDRDGRLWRASVVADSSWTAAARVGGDVVAVVDGGAA